VSAALEYAVDVLRVQHIVVLGHARCGGIQAFANNAPPGDFIGKWISLLAPAAAAVRPRAEAPGSYLTRLEQASLLASLENLKTFPFVRIRCERGTLALHGAYFDVASGELSVLDQAAGRFVAIAGA
jgi:carbonic anhydrase